jgi:hypothetical protein
MNFFMGKSPECSRAPFLLDCCLLDARAIKHLFDAGAPTIRRWRFGFALERRYCARRMGVGGQYSFSAWLVLIILAVYL